MKVNSVMSGVLSIAAVVGLAIWLAVEHHARLRLADEHGTLEQQLKQMASLIAENEQLSNLVTRANPPQSLPDDQLRELLRLRGEVGVLRRQSKEFETDRNENRQAHAALEGNLNTQGASADYWPRNSWAFTGYASPDAALQTSLWAANSGDMKALLASTTGDLRKMMEKAFESKSGSEASIQAMDGVASLKSVRIFNREVQADDVAILTVVFENRTDFHKEKLLMKKIGNDWKFSGPVN